MEREFRGVWIPAPVWLDQRLTLVEKALLAEIDSFSGNGKTFHKSNDTIQVEYGISKNTIARALRKLEALQYINVTFNGRVRHCSVRLGCIPKTGKADSPNWEGSLPKMERQSPQNGDAASPNIPATNTIENTVDKTVKTSKARPKGLEEVLEAFRLSGSSDDEASAFFDYYEANGWTQGRNKKIKDWKAAARGWMRRTKQFKTNDRSRKGTSGAGPTDGSLIEQHLRRLANGSGGGMA